jgi:hypothetical protein
LFLCPLVFKTARQKQKKTKKSQKKENKKQEKKSSTREAHRNNNLSTLAERDLGVQW